MLDAFQSTPALRKVTTHYFHLSAVCSISIHTFLAEGDAEARKRRALNGISIHTFLAEGDVKREFTWDEIEHFNPHLPCGR